jgi:ABC-2 type transport system ATP-binding protein
MIKISNISYSYGKHQALSDVSITIEKNSIFGIVGPNGAGKSTLIKLLLSILHIQDGNIDVEDGNKCGVVMEDLGMFPGFSARKNLQIVATIKNSSYDEIDIVLQKVGLQESANRKVKQLSFGLKQRLSIASALLGFPNVLILDEPTNGLDPIAIIQLRELINDIAKENITIIIASHILTEIEKICSDVAIMNKGKIIHSDSLVNIRNKYNSLENAFINLINENNGL